MGRYLWAEVLLFEVLHIIALYPTPHHAQRVVILAAMLYVAAQVYLTLEANFPLAVLSGVASHIFTTFAFTAYVLYAEGSFPDHWRRVRDEDHPKSDAGGLDNRPSNFSLTNKLWWMLDLAYSLRMIGWVQEPRPCHPPPRPIPSRRVFLWKTFLKLTVNIIILDLTTLMFAQNPVLDSRVHDPTDGPETYFAAVPFSWRVPYVVVGGIRVRSMLSIIHNILVLVCVGLGGSSPALWPDLWGRWGDAYTVRRLWGKTWHQMLRSMILGFGRLVATKLLKFPRGTKRCAYIQLYVAFSLSATIHSIGDSMVERRMVFRSFRFFLLQAVAITFEDFIVQITKHLLLKRGIELNPGRAEKSWVGTAVRVIGYCWVILWLCFTVPLWQDGNSVTGVNNVDRGPIAQFLWDNTWKQWA